MHQMFSAWCVCVCVSKKPFCQGSLWDRPEVTCKLQHYTVCGAEVLHHLDVVPVVFVGSHRTVVRALDRDRRRVGLRSIVCVCV